MTENSAVNRAILSFATAAQGTAEHMYVAVANLATDTDPVESLRKARRGRLSSLNAMDFLVVAWWLKGATWEQIAEGTGKRTATDAERVYTPLIELWLEADDEALADSNLGQYAVTRSADVVETAEALDQWARRHAERPVEDDETPVSSALVDGQAAPGDSQGV